MPKETRLTYAFFVPPHPSFSNITAASHGNPKTHQHDVVALGLNTLKDRLVLSMDIITAMDMANQLMRLVSQSLKEEEKNVNKQATPC